ncbi:MAG: archease [Actinobacteria bacterium]|nr:archease [Actinomycetota bacterium]
MKLNYSIIDHLSDIGIEVKARSPEELFENAALGMFSIMYDLKGIESKEKVKVYVKGKRGTDIEELLISWLEKLLYLFETKNLLFCRFDINDIETAKSVKFVDAVAYGEKINLARHKFFTAVKAPTYHMLKVEKNEKARGIWTARIIFDV